jgi:hypothetical protein
MNLIERAQNQILELRRKNARILGDLLPPDRVAYYERTNAEQDTAGRGP